MLMNREQFRIEAKGSAADFVGNHAADRDRDILIRAKNYPRTESAIVRPKTSNR
jgi:hypothetical protein